MVGQESHRSGNQSEGAATPTPAMVRKLSDLSLRERTGHGWEEWFRLLDAWGATGRSHAEIARWLVAEHQVDNWSTQSVTVGYEQARGLRAPGQQSNKGFATSATKIVAVPVDRVAVAHERLTGVEAVAEMKAYWRGRLTVLKEILES